jgi:hypothetical protein
MRSLSQGIDEAVLRGFDNSSSARVRAIQSISSQKIGVPEKLRLIEEKLKKRISESSRKEAAPQVNGNDQTRLHIRPFEGTVTNLLDTYIGPKGKHQQFMVLLDDGKEMEVRHNTTLAPEVPVHIGESIKLWGVQVGDPVSGLPVIHWTHKNYRNGKIAGCIQLEGKIYE